MSKLTVTERKRKAEFIYLLFTYATHSVTIRTDTAGDTTTLHAFCRCDARAVLSI